MTKVAIIGYGYVGKAYSKLFPDSVICDEPLGVWAGKYKPVGDYKNIKHRPSIEISDGDIWQIYDQTDGRAYVNECDIAIVCVPTQPTDSNELDMSIVEDVVEWLETPLILIKSALQPSTVDRLVKKTGKKIAVSVELIGEGNYPVPYWKYPHPTDPTLHQCLIVGGEEETARKCADVLWANLSPSIDIHLVSAIEAELCKLMENAWGATKVTFANSMYDICNKLGANYTKVLQAWGSDGRVEKMHMRVIDGNRGWGGKCYPKDVGALATLDDNGFFDSVIKTNDIHRDKNPS